MELIATRSATRAATMALCPRFNFLAAAPAARAPGGCGSEGSRVEILRVWRKAEDPGSGRDLEVLATIPVPGDGCFNRLAWSPHDANSPYPLGLLAGALDGGGVYVWDPSLLPCEENASQIGDDYACHFTLSKFASDFFGSPSSSTNHSNTRCRLNKFPEKFQEKVEEEAFRLALDLNNLIEGNFTVKDHKESTPNAGYDSGDFEGWEFLPGSVGFDLEEWELLPNKITEVTGHGKTDGLLLKLHDMKGQVLGLSFNNPSGNILACGGKCEMIGIVSHEANAQITSLAWNPVYPVQIASACDASIAKIWDLRANKPTIRFPQQNKGYCTEVCWNPRHPLQIAVASKGTKTSDPVELWDARIESFPLCNFGPKKGVVSLAWSPNPNMILTTDEDGVVDAWKLNETQCSNPFWTTYRRPDHIPLHATGKEEILWCENEDAVAVSCSTNIGLYKVKPLSRIGFSC